MADARIVSNYFVQCAKDEENTLTPMQVLKLVYIAHGYHLGHFGTPLISNRIEAWKFGPVIPELYRAIKDRRDKPVEQLTGVHLIDDDLDDDEKGFVRMVYGAYQDRDGIELSMLTHKDGTPWHQVYRADRSNIAIPDDLIQHHYHELLSDEYDG